MFVGRALVGAGVAAVILFVLTYVFQVTALRDIGTGSVENAPAAEIQGSLSSNLPSTGTYSVPSNSTPEQTVMYGQGPIATIHYNQSGFAFGGTSAMVGGFVQCLIVALLMAAGLGAASRFVPGNGERIRLLLLGVIGATAFIHLREPIWFHHDWGHFLYMFVTDTLSLLAAGFAILKLLPSGAGAARSEPETPRG